MVFPFDLLTDPTFFETIGYLGILFFTFSMPIICLILVIIGLADWLKEKYLKRSKAE